MGSIIFKPQFCRTRIRRSHLFDIINSMNIDTKARLTGGKSIVINAFVNHVWAIQSDINNWPKWQKDISYANLEGKLVKGTVFKWKAMGMSITSELQEVVVNRAIGWTGKSLGMVAVHYWGFEKQGNKTRVTTKESLSGWFPIIIKIVKPNFLDESLTKALNILKNYSEATK